MSYEPDQSSLKTTTLIIYILYACAYFNGLTAIIGVIIAYIKKGDASDLWTDAHFKWQINTFWIIVIGGVLGYLTLIIFIGFAILGVTFIWSLYRIIKGFIRYDEERSPY